MVTKNRRHEHRYIQVTENLYMCKTCGAVIDNQAPSLLKRIIQKILGVWNGL